VTLGLVGLGTILLGGMSLYFSAANRKRLRGDEDETVAGMSEEEIDELGDRNPRYVYTE